MDFHVGDVLLFSFCFFVGMQLHMRSKLTPEKPRFNCSIGEIEEPEIIVPHVNHPLIEFMKDVCDQYYIPSICGDPSNRPVEYLPLDIYREVRSEMKLDCLPPGENMPALGNLERYAMEAFVVYHVTGKLGPSYPPFQKFKKEICEQYSLPVCRSDRTELTPARFLANLIHMYGANYLVPAVNEMADQSPRIRAWRNFRRQKCGEHLRNEPVVCRLYFLDFRPWMDTDQCFNSTHYVAYFEPN